MTSPANTIYHGSLSIARSNPLRDGNHQIVRVHTGCGAVYSEVEPFEGWKREGFLCFLALSLEVYSEVEPFEGWKLLIQATLLR